MTAKQYLAQLNRLDARIESNCEILERLKSLAEKTTTVYTEAKSGTSIRKDRTADIVCKIIDLQEKINKDIDDLIDLKTKILCNLEFVANDEYRILLTLRYFNNHTWEVISEKMGYTLRWTYTIHGRALQDFHSIIIKKALKSTISSIEKH